MFPQWMCNCEWPMNEWLFQSFVVTGLFYFFNHFIETAFKEATQKYFIEQKPTLKRKTILKWPGIFSWPREPKQMYNKDWFFLCKRATCGLFKDNQFSGRNNI